MNTRFKHQYLDRSPLGVNDLKTLFGLRFELQGASGNHEAEVFQVSNDDTAVAQRRLEDKQLKGRQATDFGLHKCLKRLWLSVLYRNMGFNESGEYKKTFIGSGAGTGSMQVLHEFEFEEEPLGDHTFKVEPQENVDQGAGLHEVQTQDFMDYQLARDRDQHLACELFGYREDSNEAAFVVDVVEKIYAHESLTFNNTVASTVAGNAVTTAMAITGSMHKIWATKGLLDKAKGNVLGMEIVRDQSGNTLRVSQSRFYNGKLVQTLLEGHSILSLKGSLSGDCDVKKMMWVWYGLMILGCAGSLKANFQHIEALSTTEAGYMTFIEAWKKEIWLKGLLTESRYELRLVAGIATSALVKGGSRSEVQHKSRLLRIGFELIGAADSTGNINGKSR
ncbi:hypothetical protein Tco_0666909 [Tanacetum coccineum]